MSSEKPQPPDVRTKWTQRSLEVGFVFGAALAALLWLAAGFRYALLVIFFQQAVSPGPIVFGVMLAIITIPVFGFGTAVLFGMVVFFAELFVRSARRGTEPDVRVIGRVLSQAERRFRPSPPAEPPADTVHPPEGLTEPAPDPGPAPPGDEIRP
jgi:multidrug efflux pump subunit AcrB